MPYTKKPRRSQYPLYSEVRKIFHARKIKYRKIGNSGLLTNHQQDDIPPIAFRFDTGIDNRVKIYPVGLNSSWSFECIVNSGEELLIRAAQFYFTVNRFHI